MLAWKIARARHREDRRAEAAELRANGARFCAHLSGGASQGRRRDIVTGDGSTGEALVQHSDVDKIAFTGSRKWPRHSQSYSAEPQKLPSNLVENLLSLFFEDAIWKRRGGAVDGIWFNQGRFVALVRVY